jgi:hypothetical protein
MALFPASHVVGSLIGFYSICGKTDLWGEEIASSMIWLWAHLVGLFIDYLAFSSGWLPRLWELGWASSRCEYYG